MFTCVLYFYQKTIVFFGRTRVYCSYLFMIYYMLMFNYVQVVLSFLLILEKRLLPGDGSEMVLLDEFSLVIVWLDEGTGILFLLSFVRVLSCWVDIYTRPHRRCRGFFLLAHMIRKQLQWLLALLAIKLLPGGAYFALKFCVFPRLY